MKLHEIKILETILFGEIPPHVIDSTLEYLKQNGKHIGDQDSKRVMFSEYHDNLIYGIENDGKITSILTMSKSVDAHGFNTIGIVYTAPEYRGKKDLHRLLWFIKNDEGKTLISSGVQSEDGMGLMKALSKSQRFVMHWFNLKTGEKEKYDHLTDENPSKYRKTETQTPWRIIIEGDETPLFKSKFMESFGGRVWHMFERHDVKYADQGLGNEAI